MRIAIFARSLPSHPHSGGMETQTDILARGLVQEGHEVAVITTPFLEKQKNQESGEAEYQVISTPKGDHTRYTKEYFRGSVEIFEKLHREAPFDCVISESAAGFGYATRLKHILKVPEVIIQHGTLWGEVLTLWGRASILTDYLRFFGRILPYALKNYLLLDLPHFRRVDQIIAVSQDVQEQLFAQYYVSRKKVTVIYNGIDEKRFKILPEAEKSKMRKELGYGQGDIVLVYIGRLIKEKGLQDVIEILARFPEFVKLLLVGEGDYQKDLKDQISKVKLEEERVKFVGKVAYEDVPNYYSMSDIFVFPSHRREGFPMSLVEAQACGLPIVLSDCGGSVEAILSEETGFVYQMGDLEEFFIRLNSLVTSPPLRQDMSHNARKRVETFFSAKVMVKNTLEILHKLSKSPLLYYGIITICSGPC